VAVQPITTAGVFFTDDLTATPPLPFIGDPASVVVITAKKGADNAALTADAPDRAAIRAFGKYGMEAYGTTAPIRLVYDTREDPPALTDFHQAGELLSTGFQGTASLWFCVEDGTPGKWILVASPLSGSTFCPSGPYRVYDSRDGDGPIHTGQTRTIFLDAGQLASSVVVNLTVAGTTGAGYLTLYPTSVANPAVSSSINWFTQDQVTANMAIVMVDAGGNAKIRAGGPGTTDFIIDVIGFFA
jgi:hypothetical protein